LRGHELGGEHRQLLLPVMSKAGLQRDGLPVNVTELGEPRSNAIHWHIDVVRRSWQEKRHFRPATCGLGAGTRPG
jgi:hypothetical protein